MGHYGFMSAWLPDILLPGYQAHTWVLDAARLADEPEGPLTATLVRRNAPRHDRAVLYLHGWDDYFFQTHMADWFDAHGYDFYAIDLRRYGRNLRKGLYAGYVSDLRDYFQELDHSVALIREDSPSKPITFMGHSTGGLIGALWAGHRPRLLDGVMLNSPWLDMQGSPVFWRVMAPLAGAMAAINPLMELSIYDSGFYKRSLHASEEGEWNWDTDFKSNPAFVPRFGWGRAILGAQGAVARGLHIDTPVLVLTSDRSDFSRTWRESMHGADLVLDVRRIGAAALHLGDLVTVRRVHGAVHDVVLSQPAVRRTIFDEMARWLGAYTGQPEGAQGYWDLLGAPEAPEAGQGPETGQEKTPQPK